MRAAEGRRSLAGAPWPPRSRRRPRAPSRRATRGPCRSPRSASAAPLAQVDLAVVDDPLVARCRPAPGRWRSTTPRLVHSNPCSSSVGLPPTSPIPTSSPTQALASRPGGVRRAAASTAAASAAPASGGRRSGPRAARRPAARHLGPRVRHRALARLRRGRRRQLAQHLLQPVRTSSFLPFEQRSQLVERAGESRADRGRRQAEHPGQLARAVAEHVAQHDERALRRGRAPRARPSARRTSRRPARRPPRRTPARRSPRAGAAAPAPSRASG